MVEDVLWATITMVVIARSNPDMGHAHKSMPNKSGVNIIRKAVHSFWAFMILKSCTVLRYAWASLVFFEGW